MSRIKINWWFQFITCLFQSYQNHSYVVGKLSIFLCMFSYFETFSWIIMVCADNLYWKVKLFARGQRQSITYFEKTSKSINFYHFLNLLTNSRNLCHFNLMHHGGLCQPPCQQERWTSKMKQIRLYIWWHWNFVWLI